MRNGVEEDRNAPTWNANPRQETTLKLGDVQQATSDCLREKEARLPGLSGSLHVLLGSWPRRSGGGVVLVVFGENV